MVKPPPLLPPKKNAPHLLWLGGAMLIAITGFFLYFGLPPFIDIDDEGNYVLSKSRQKDYLEKSRGSEEVEVYQLLALTTGLYPCLRCPGVKAVRLNVGEVWKYGISRNGKNRYPAAFYMSNKVEYHPITTTDILTAEQMEKELIIAYPLLPECQHRMKTHGIFLKRPPGNAIDR